MREFKDIPNSKLSIREIVGRGEDQHGNEIIKTRWVETDREVSLGSLAKPNTKILSFKYEVPQENTFFKGLFGQ